MPRIYVRAVHGRVVRESPRGNLIPDDRFVAVHPTAYINRLIHTHGDLVVKEVEKAPKKAPAASNAPKSE